MRLPILSALVLASGLVPASGIPRPVFAQSSDRGSVAAIPSSRSSSQWSADGIARMAPQMSEVLGSIFAGAEHCGLTDEARAVARKQDEHRSRLAQEVPQFDLAALERSFADASASYRDRPVGDCGDSQKMAIRTNLPDVFTSIDAFHDALTPQR
jgi:hypothetical protein